MLGGYVGKILRVDLTTGTLRDEALPSEATLRKYIGGLGLAARILYDEVPVNCKPLDPENRLIFMTGPLGGTAAPSTAQCSVACLSAETGYTIGVGHFHGFWGSTLKYAGYDGIIVQGASKKPVMLWINDGKAELRDAAALWGMGTNDTEDKVREILGEPLAEVACIGPGGENLIKGGAICHGYHHMVAKGGTGTVMGSKKLKAIAVLGTGGVQVVDPDALLEESIIWRQDAWAPTAIAPNGVGNGGVTRMWYDIAGDAYWLAFKNLNDPEGGRAMGKKIVELAKKSKVLPQGSFSCPVACAYRFIVGEGPRKGYAATPGGGGENIEGSAGLMGVDDPATNYWLTDQFDNAGLDSATPGAAMGLLFELYERGIATKKDTDGIECKWGNADAVYALLQKMLKREGIGAVLAEGPRAVADRFGPEAHKYAVHIKGTGYNMHDWRPMWATTFSYGVSTAGPCHQGVGPEVTAETDLGYDAPLPWDTAEGKAEATRRMQRRKHWDDSNGTCWFVAIGVPNVTKHSVRCVAATTGWSDLTKEEAWQTGERIANLMRAFSVRRGHSPKDDLDFGGRLLEAPANGVGKGKTVAPHLKSMLGEYYGLMGWDPETGMPTAEKLRELDLEDVAKDLAGVQVKVKLSDIPWEGTPEDAVRLRQ